MILYALKIRYRILDPATLDSRALREILLRFVDEGSEYYGIFNWHERDVPRVIYSKPTYSFGVVYSSLPDVLDYAGRRISRRLVRVGRGLRVAVSGAELYKLKWKVENAGKIFLYLTRTEMITGVNSTEMKINTAVKNRGTVENLENDVLANVIRRTVGHMYETWFGFKPDMSGLRVKIIDGKHFLDYGYKEGTCFPAWRGYFLSNYRLPPFVGYKVGLGRGELSIKSEVSPERAKTVFGWEVKS